MVLHGYGKSWLKQRTITMENSVYFWLLVTITFSVSAISWVFARRRGSPITLRAIAGYQAMPLVVDEAIESAQRVHLSLGSVGIGQTSTIDAIAALSLVHELATRQAFTQTTPLVTVSDALTLPLAQDNLRRVYRAYNNLDTYYYSNAAVWYPQGERSLAFGAGVATLNSTENVSGSITIGRFGAEIAFLGEANLRRDTTFIGHSTDLTGQAIAYAQSDTPLIGEELFASDAYVDPSSPSAISKVITLDTLRWVAIAAIIVLALLN